MLALAFVPLAAAVGSAVLAASVVGLNLPSIGAAYGLLVAVFQHSWAEGLPGSEADGAIVDWPALLASVILSGLSMDHTCRRRVPRPQPSAERSPAVGS